MMEFANFFLPQWDINLEISKGTRFFDLNYDAQSHLCTSTGLTHLQKFRQEVDGNLLSSQPLWIPPTKKFTTHK